MRCLMCDEFHFGRGKYCTQCKPDEAIERADKLLNIIRQLLELNKVEEALKLIKDEQSTNTNS